MIKPKDKGCLKRFWGNLDEKYFKPWLIYRYNDRKVEIKQAKKKMKMNSDKFKGAETGKNSLLSSIQNPSESGLASP